MSNQVQTVQPPSKVQSGQPRRKFMKPTKKRLKSRIAIAGSSGSGKTRLALEISQLLGRTALIDTEYQSASHFADDYDHYGVMELDTFGTNDLVSALQEAADPANGFDCVVIDSFSHFWEGNGGLLEQQSIFEKTVNKNMAWMKTNPLWREQVSAIMNCPLHVILTLRTKNDWQSVEDRGKEKLKIVGTKPITRDNFEYELDLLVNLGREGQDYSCEVAKSRCPAMSGKAQNNVDATFFQPYFDWLKPSEKPPAQENLV